MSKAPILTVPNPSGNGRPIISEEQYVIWLEDMAPYLKLASTLYWAISKAGLITHKTEIYEKYKRGDWFAEKVDGYRRQVGEQINNTAVRLANKIDEKVKQDIPLTKDELDYLKWFSEKHRTAQPFFVTRTEQVVKDDKEVGKILDILEGEQTDYETVGREAQKQMVAVNPPIQNKGQDGGAGDVQAELPATATPSGTGSPQV